MSKINIILSVYDACNFRRVGTAYANLHHMFQTGQLSGNDFRLVMVDDLGAHYARWGRVTSSGPNHGSLHIAPTARAYQLLKAGGWMGANFPELFIVHDGCVELDSEQLGADLDNLTKIGKMNIVADSIDQITYLVFSRWSHGNMCEKYFDDLFNQPEHEIVTTMKTMQSQPFGLTDEM